MLALHYITSINSSAVGMVILRASGHGVFLDFIYVDKF